MCSPFRGMVVLPPDRILGCAGFAGRVLGSGQLGAGSNCSPEVSLPKVFGDGQPGNAGTLQKQKL
jgi:hypothetical protein